MKIFTAAQIREWDKFTIKEEQITSTDLMERSASGCFNWLQQNIPLSKHCAIFCGTGNNGGDGLVIARLLYTAKYKVTVYILDNKKRSDDFTINLVRLSPLKIDLFYLKSVKDFPLIISTTLIIDALFGTGVNRPLKNVPAQLVNHINKIGATIISIDMPSGLIADDFSGTESIIKAHQTLSFQTNKLAFFLPGNFQFTGKIHLINILLKSTFYTKTTTTFQTIDKELIQKIYKPRNNFAHKYNFGHSLIYAGSKNMMGAAIICTKACLRSGAGLATIQVAFNCEATIHISLPEAITTTSNDTTKTWLKKSAIAIGPGLQNSSSNKLLIKKLLISWDEPLVIDATALSILKPLTKLLPLRKNHPAILTPHAGEFEKLFGKTNNTFETMTLAIKKSAALNCYIILKGHNTLIACPDGTHFINTTGNAGMATAGSGDALTGIVCGLLAQAYTERDACIFGVYLHGLAGDIAAEKSSPEAMLASDITDCLGDGYKRIRNCN